MEYTNIVRMEVENQIAVITLDNPPANAWGLSMATEFEMLWDQAENDPEVRVIVLTGGEANCFSAGYDVTDAPNSNITSPKVRALWRRIDRSEKPIICALNGHALGGGLELSLCCHFRVMTDNPKAMLGLTELNLGIIPGWGGTQRLARVVGRPMAMQMILFSKRLSPQEALNIGIVDQVVPADQLMATVLTMAQTLAERPPVAVRWVLKSLSTGLYEGLDAGLKTEEEGAAAVRVTEDRAEGFAAFKEKRKPVFKGL